MSSGAGSLNIKKDEYDSGHEGCDPNLQGDGSLDADDDQQFSQLTKKNLHQLDKQNQLIDRQNEKLQ